MLVLVSAEGCMKHSDISRVRRMRRWSRRAPTKYGRLRVSLRFTLDRLLVSSRSSRLLQNPSTSSA